MARRYARDKNGRFASGGGGGSGGKKASGGTSTAAKNKAAKAAMAATGQTAIGGRLTSRVAGRFSGSAATKRRNAESITSRSTGRFKGAGARAGSGVISGRASVRAAQSKAIQRAAGRRASKGAAKTAPAPMNPAKAQYRNLRSQARSLEKQRVYSSPGDRSTGAKAGAAKRKLASFVASRGTSKKRKK